MEIYKKEILVEVQFIDIAVECRKEEVTPSKTRYWYDYEPRSDKIPVTIIDDGHVCQIHLPGLETFEEIDQKAKRECRDNVGEDNYPFDIHSRDEFYNRSNAAVITLSAGMSQWRKDNPNKKPVSVAITTGGAIILYEVREKSTS